MTRSPWLLCLLVACESPSGSPLPGDAAVTSAPLPAVEAPPSPPPPASAAPCLDLTAPNPGAPPEPPLVLHDAKDALHGVHVSTRAPWRSLRARGFSFALAAAAYGGQPNRDFGDNWRMMRRCGFPRGAYHFVVADRDGAAQAAVFVKQLAGDFGELPPVIDVERPVGCATTCCDRPCGHWRALVRGWLEVVEKAAGRKAMIYTVEPFWNECLCGTRELADRPLWLGAWPKFDFPRPNRFGGWARWSIYHYAGNVRFAGGVVDVDLLAGGRSELEALRSSVAAVP